MSETQNKFRNRHGDEYWFEPAGEKTYLLRGDLKYWRYGGKEGQHHIDLHDLGFVDPSGGPFISEGYPIEGKKIVRIQSQDEQIYLHVE